MTSDESLLLIRKAVGGDREAWEDLVQRYLPRWLGKFHGRIGRDLHPLCDTEDLVHSAIGDALRDAKQLRSEGAFFGWVCAIARRKLAEQRRRGRDRRRVPLTEVAPPADAGPTPAAVAGEVDDYRRLLDAVLTLYRHHPEPMAAIYFKYFERLKMDGVRMALGTSERTAYRLVDEGLRLLRAELGAQPGGGADRRS